MDRQELKQLISEIISRKAVNPAQGGNGEKERAEYIERLLNDWGVKTERYTVIDDKGIERVSIVATIKGKQDKYLWIISHIDTVSADPAKWETDPFKAVFIDNKVYGRGVSDNGIGIFSSLLLIKELIEEKPELEYGLKIGFFADEEAGSNYGLIHVLNNTQEFSNAIGAIIPDVGSSDGSLVEIAEKAILWIKIRVIGKQAHGSMPSKGVNAMLHGMKFNTWLYKELHEAFSDENELFDPKGNTFEPTRKEENVKGINIIPGEDIVYWDNRILPSHTIEEVMSFIKQRASQYEEQNNVKIEIEQVMSTPSSITPNNEFVKKFVEVLLKKGIKPEVKGIGGGTFAGILRNKGIQSIGWGIDTGTEHQPNEYEVIDHYYLMKDILKEFISTYH